MRSLGIPGVAGGAQAIMEALHTLRQPTRATTDLRHLRVFTAHPATDLRPMVAAALRHRPML